MAETRKIKVKDVRAADPQLFLTLEATDDGDFPARVMVSASLTNAADGGVYSGGEIQNGGSDSDISYDILFADGSFSTETSLAYTLAVFFSSDGLNWTQLPDADVEGYQGTVAVPPPPAPRGVVEDVVGGAPSGQGAKNKGCLAFLGMLPF